MKQTTWFHTITRPWGPLLGTAAVIANVIVCGSIATANPQSQPGLVVIAAAPALVWYAYMGWVHHRGRTGSHDKAGSPHEGEPPG